MILNEQIKPILQTLLVAGVLVVLLSQFIIGNAAFDQKQKEITLDAGNSWLEERQERNLASMNQNYSQFMTLGQSYLQEEYVDIALHHFFNAKTLFPERMGPRKNLCYSYLIKCQEDGRWCNHAKREIYYAMRYVDDSDEATKTYIQELAQMVDMDSLLQMEEGDMLSSIYLSENTSPAQ